MRDCDWKLIEFFEDGHLELYNLREDIGEDRDLTTSDPVRLEVMADQLHTWQREIEAIIPRPNPHYIPPDPANGVDPAEV